MSDALAAAIVVVPADARVVLARPSSHRRAAPCVVGKHFLEWRRTMQKGANVQTKPWNPAETNMKKLDSCHRGAELAELQMLLWLFWSAQSPPVSWEGIGDGHW